MAGRTKIRRKSDAKEDYSHRSDDESATASRASRASTVKKRRKKSSVASTAASTSSSVKMRAATNTKAMKEADSVMSGLVGLGDASKLPRKKKKVPRKIKRKTSHSDESIETDDGISCLTDNSKISKGTKGTKKKKKSSPKKTKRADADADAVDDTYNKYNRPDSEGTLRIKNRLQNKINHVPASRSKNDDDVSCLSETSTVKRNKKIALTKLNRKDRLYNTKNNKQSVGSMASSVNSAYYSRGDDGSDDVSQRKARTRSSSRHSRASAAGASPTASSKSSTKKKTKKSGKDGGMRRKILPDGSVKRSRSLDHDDTLVSESSDDSVSISLSDSSNEDMLSTGRSKSPRRISSKRADVRRSNSVASRKMKNKKTPSMVKKHGSLPMKTGNNSSHTSASFATTSSRRKPPPVRIAARSNSIEVRSMSADNVKKMQMSLTNNSSNKSENANSNMNGRPQLRRGIMRNKSAPLRSAMRSPSQSALYRKGPGGGPYQQRAPLRSTKSAFLQQPQQRPPPRRRNSEELSVADHVEMLNVITKKGSFDKAPSPSQRSSSLPRGDLKGTTRDNRRERQTSPPSRSLSPGISCNSSHRPDRNEINKKQVDFMYSAELDEDEVLYSSDLDSSNLNEDEGSVALNFDGEDYGYRSSEHEELNDSKHVVNFNRRDMIRTKSKRLRRSSSLGSFSGFSTHSFMSNRSQMSMDTKELFQDESRWKAALRYIHLLPPHKEETRLTKRIRIFTWTAMTLDFFAALVAAFQFGGSVQCCGEPLFNVFWDFNWSTLFKVVIYLYLCLIFAEIIPVIKSGIPFNIVNPTIGFIITFGMFFDDSITEAVSMWVIEALAIFFEFLVYRVNARMHYETCLELDEVDEELKDFLKKRKQAVGTIRQLAADSMHGGSIHGGSRHSGSIHGGSIHGGSRHSGSIHGGSRHGGSRHGSRHSTMPNSTNTSTNTPLGDLEMGGNSSLQNPHVTSRDDDYDDDDSSSGQSFGDEDFYDEKTPSGRDLTNNTVTKTTAPPARTIKARQELQSFEQISRTASKTVLSRTNSRDTLGANSTHSHGASIAATNIAFGNRFRQGEVKHNRLLRKRRILRENKKAQSNELHYHFLGTVLNVGIAAIAMILIVTIASTGGLCFNNDHFQIFSYGQLARCDACPVKGADKGDVCEVCDIPGGNQCFYPYY